MANATLPLVILTWLRQLQEHFFEQPENNPHIDWNDLGRYCNVPQKFAVKQGVNDVYMAKANNKNPVKIESFDDIKPNNKDSKKVVKSLFEWADKILDRESVYMQDITKSIEKGGNTSKPTKYTMTAKNYQDTSQVETIDGEIETVTPEDQEHKTPAHSSTIDFDRLWFHDWQNCKIAKENRQKNVELINNTKQAAACLVEYVNKVEKREPKFKSLDELKKQLTKETHVEKGGVSSEEEESDEYENDDEE